jgi:pyruvate dehydrogenase E1 component alpha subunit
MNKEEMEQWMERDPIVIYADKLKKAGMLTEKDIETINEEAENEVEEAVEYAQSSPEPKPEDALKDVFV